MQRLARTLSLIAFLLTAAVRPCRAQFVDSRRIGTSPMGHDEWATQVLYTPSGKEIVSVGADGRIATWDAATGKLLREVVLAAPVLALDISKDGSTLAVGDASGRASIIRTDSGQITASFVGDKEVVNAVSLSGDGKFLAASGPKGVVSIWSVTESKLVNEIDLAKGNVVALSFAGMHLIVGTLDKNSRKYSIELLDWNTKKHIRSFDAGAPGMRGIAISPDGKLLAITNYQKASLLFFLFGEGGSVEASLRTLPESDDPQPVSIWDIASGKLIAEFEAETGARHVSFSPNGRYLTTCGANGVMIFDAGDGTYAEIGRIDSATGVDAAAFSPDSQRVAIARQRQPMAQYGGEYALDRLTDPFFTSIVMTVREGARPSFTKSKGAKSITGGSNVEIWQIEALTKAPDARSWEAVKAFFAGRKDESRDILDQILKDHPENSRAGRLYAVLFEQSDLKKAAARLESIIKTDVGCVGCWRTLGDIYHGTKQFDRALDAYKQVLKLRPEIGLVAGRSAAIYGQMGLDLISAGNDPKNLQAASNALGEALARRPAEERYITNMASIAYFQGDFDTSIKLLLISRSLRPDHSRIYYNLGHSYRAKGEKKNAIEAYKTYVRLGEEGQQARVERAKQFITELSR
jgi:Flp pilus assembly protein TadD/DNA-binding beta-propeller fold protein YncE